MNSNHLLPLFKRPKKGEKGAGDAVGMKMVILVRE